jgi:hypothetical protein
MGDVGGKDHGVPGLPGKSNFMVVKHGESVDSIAYTMAQSTYRLGQHQQIKAILIHNNKITETVPLRPGQLLNVDDRPCEQNAWFPGVSVCPELHGYSPDLRELLQNEGRSLPLMMGLANQADGAGWTVGMDDVLNAGGYMVLAADSGIAAGATMLGQIRALGKKVVEEAMAKFGREMMMSRDAAKLETVQRFVRTNTSYVQMQNLLATLPKQLKKGLGHHLTPTQGVQAADARWVRRLVQVEEKGAAHFFRAAGSLLEGKISRLESIGRGTTFVLPAAIGLYNVAKADPNEKFRVGVEETVAVGLGAVGTELGAGVGTVLVAAMGLTGVGAFLMLFAAAGASAYAFAEGGKSGVKRLGDLLQ